MENILRKLFDYQKFENNPRLSKIIDEVQTADENELSDDDLFFVSAAGDMSMFFKDNANS